MVAETCEDNLLKLATTYAAANKITLSVVSKRAYGNSRFFDRLKKSNGRLRGVGVDQVDKLLDFFRDNWPEGTEKPFLMPPVMSLRNSGDKRPK